MDTTQSSLHLYMVGGSWNKITTHTPKRKKNMIHQTARRDLLLQELETKAEDFFQRVSISLSLFHTLGFWKIFLFLNLINSPIEPCTRWLWPSNHLTKNATAALWVFNSSHLTWKYFIKIKIEALTLSHSNHTIFLKPENMER